MSFSVQLYRNGSPNLKVDKNITLIYTATGALRNGSSVLNPVITIEPDVPSTAIAVVNYAYIPEFERYYYTGDPYTDTNGLWTIPMHVDVLMSFKTGIRNQSAIVARQENVYNMYLDDGWFMAYQNPDIQPLYFSQPSPFEAEEYILVIAGS